MITATIDGDRIVTKDDAAHALYSQSRWGSVNKSVVQYSSLETYSLFESRKLRVVNSRGSELSEEQLLRKLKKEPNFWTRYLVFKDLRKRGYIVKTAFKFGADFRVYDRGVKPGEDHAKWVVFPVAEQSKHTWHEFSAKNRVAHSTKKRLLLGVVDDEDDVTYYEVKWVRP